VKESYKELEERLTRKSDKALARIKKARKTERDGQTRMYAAARSSRLNGDWQVANTSADSELSASLTQLRARSRALCRDVSYAKRAKQLVVNNVIGTGIGMQGQVYTTRNELNDRVNAEIEEVFDAWGCGEYCHTGGRLAFSMLERSLMAQVFEAGEVLVRKHYRRFADSPIPFALEVIEAERIADDLFKPSYDRGRNEVRMGVEVDNFGRPVAYYIRKRHPGELRFAMNMTPDEIERVPADQIIHLAFGDRWPQTRGEPWMSAVIRTAKDMAGYIEAEITRARAQASIPWTIETSESTTSLGSPQSDGSVEMTVEAGIAKRLNPGEKMNVPALGSPNPQVEAFMRYLLRDFASGLGVSYASLSADYSQGNYSSSRLALLDDRDVWRAFQAWFLLSFRLPVHKEWLRQGVLAEVFETFTMTQYALDPQKYEAVRFRPRGWGWVDPTKEVEAFKEAVRCGFMTQQDVLAQSGADVEEVIEQRAKEVALAKHAQLVLDIDPANDKAMEAKPAEPPADDPSDDDQDDDEEADGAADRRVLSLKR
jgi:lambda family phage portal protein